MEDLTGRQLGQYRIVAPLGEGGMAVVYKAYQPSTERYVGLKILPRQYAADPDFVRRFKQEARIIASLEHPNILPVYDYGETDGYTYLVMRYVEGGSTLTDLMRGQPLPLSRICEILSKVSAALDYAHSRGVVHRDVKPSNVLIDQQGNLLLSDFGLAKVLLSSVKLTISGAFLGTPTYASPEQCLGHQDVDGRSDIYSLGVMLYEMAVGRPPFDAETPMAIVVKHIHDPLPRPRTLNPALSEAVERVILKALAKQPENRYQTAGMMAEALKAATTESAKESTAGLPPTAAPLTTATARRRPIPAWGWALGCLGMLAMLTIAVGLGIALVPELLKPASTSTALAHLATPAVSSTPRQAISPTFPAATGTPISSLPGPTLTPSAGASLLKYGDVRTEILSSPGEVDNYVFEGRAGDVVIINAAGAEESPWLNLEIEVLDPQGNMIQGGMSSNFYLPLDGQHAVQITDSNSRTGYYLLEFGPGVLVDYGFSTTDEIHPKGDMDAYCFAGQAGDTVLMAITDRTTDGRANVSVRLLDPRGEEIASAGAWVNDTAVLTEPLFADGIYTAIVSTSGQLDSNPTGPYSLLIKNLAPRAGQKLGVGQSVEGELDPPGDVDVYLFGWQVGNPPTLTLTINRYESEIYDECKFTVEVLDAQGNSLAVNSGMQSISVKPLLVNEGEYTIRLYDAGTIGVVCTGQYAFSIK